MDIYSWNMYWICTLNYINVSIVKHEEGYLLVCIDINKVILLMNANRMLRFKSYTIHLFVIYFKKSDALNTEHENLVMLFEAWFHFGTYLSAGSDEVYWKRIWITTEKNCFLLWCVCSPIQKEEKYTKYYMPQWRLWSASRVALLRHLMGRVLVMGLVAL
jgi:hypothetical protein